MERYYAVNSISGGKPISVNCFGSRWGDSLGDQQLHTDAGHDKENT